MNSGPSATFGIMFSVTNSGSNNRLTSGDQQNKTASVMPTKAPRQKPPRISTAVTRRLESHAYFADVGEICVALQSPRHRGGNPRRLLPRRLCRHHAGGLVLLVAAGEPVVAAAVRDAEHDPESGARSAVHRLVQLRNFCQHPDCVQHLLFSDPADDRARVERGRTRSPGPCEIAARLALDPVSQDSTAG